MTNPHTATAAGLDTYLGLVEPVDGRSQPMYHLQKTLQSSGPLARTHGNLRNLPTPWEQ